jgi:hypothetical protein
LTRRKGILPRSIKCVFSDKFVREQIDPRIKELYENNSKQAPFGDFRRTWRIEHCGRLDPCPFERRDCALAFFRAAGLAVRADNPGAMFRTVAKRHALERADSRPLARETPTTSPLFDAGRMGSPASGSGDPGRGVHRSTSRPVRIGSLLGGVDPGSREVFTDDGKESPR